MVGPAAAAECVCGLPVLCAPAAAAAGDALGGLPVGQMCMCVSVCALLLLVTDWEACQWDTHVHVLVYVCVCVNVCV
jgi:hypothetical protein